MKFECNLEVETHQSQTLFLRRMRIDQLHATLIEQSCRSCTKRCWMLLSSGDPSINERLVYTLHEIRVLIQSPVRLE